jgi:hypothetical protein
MLDSYIRNNLSLILSTLYFCTALLLMGYSLGYSVLSANAADLRAAANLLGAETVALGKEIKKEEVQKEEDVQAIKSIPDFLRRINDLARENKVIIRELVPDKTDKLKYQIIMWLDYPTFLRFTASLESLNVSISDMEIRPYNLAKTPPVHLITFNITPKNDAKELDIDERYQRMHEGVAESGKRNPFIRLVALPGEGERLAIDLTYVHKLALISRVGGKLLANIDGNNYAEGETFNSADGMLTVMKVESRRVTLVKKSKAGSRETVQEYVLKFRRKRERDNGTRRRRG